jgi:hypothetical protein
LSNLKSLTKLVEQANYHTGSWYETRLSWEINAALWALYDPENDFYYPNVPDWDDLLQKTMDDSSYEKLTKDEVLSILFGLHHRNRIIDGLWTTMFEREVTPKLLIRLLVVNTD